MREVMREGREHGVVIPIPSILPEVDGFNPRIERYPVRSGDGVIVLQDEQVAGLVALVTQSEDRIERELALDVERVEAVGGRLWIRQKAVNRDGGPADRKVIAAKGCDGIWIGCVSEDRVNIGRGFVQNSVTSAGWIRGEGVGAIEVSSHGVGRVSAGVRRDGDFVFVVADAESAADHDLALIHIGRPRESNHWTKIILLRSIEISADVDIHTRQ